MYVHSKYIKGGETVITATHETDRKAGYKQLIYIVTIVRVTSQCLFCYTTNSQEGKSGPFKSQNMRSIALLVTVLRNIKYSFIDQQN